MNAGKRERQSQMTSARGWDPVGTVLMVLGMMCGNPLAAGPWPEESGDWTSPPACMP